MRRLLLVFLVTAPLPAQQVFKDSVADFSMVIPAGFQPETEERSPSGRLGCWVRTAAATSSWRRICLTRLEGSLPRDSEPPPAEFGTQVRAIRWKGFEIPAVNTSLDTESGPGTIFQALVPLRGATLRVSSAAPAEHADSARAILETALGTLEGESSWLAAPERAERLGQGIGQIGAIIMAIGVGMWIMKRRQRKQAAPSNKPRKP